MTPSTTMPTVISPSQENAPTENPPYDYSKWHLLDDVFRIRAADPVQKPLLAIPKSPRGIADFEYHTGKDLNRFTDEAAWFYSKGKIETVRTTSLLQSDVGLTVPVDDYSDGGTPRAYQS